MSRLLAIGDIHGCRAALRTVLAGLDLKTDDILVILGDVIDRGPDSRGVIDDILALRSRCNLVTLRGNHEAMMLAAPEDDEQLGFWLENGGEEMLTSYGPHATLDDVPEPHWDYLRSTLMRFETDKFVFVHANYLPTVPFDRLDEGTLLWLSLREYVPEQHFSGKTVVVGHTPQREVLDMGYLIGLDTNCCMGGWLTGMDVESRRVVQSDRDGKRRDR